MSLHTSTFYVVGLNYKKADAETRGKFSISPESKIKLLKKAKIKGFEGLMVLSTCNRTEIIGFAQHPFKLIGLLSDFWIDGSVEEFARYSYVLKSKFAIDHLFKVATGLDSQILGDYEIVGQLKEAFNQSKKVGLINTFMERLFTHVLQASKRVKNETTLSSGTTSVAYAATQFINETCSYIKEESILIYGIGEIGEHTLKNIIEYTPCKNISVINRSIISLNHIAELKQTTVYAHKDLKLAIAKSSILVVATGAASPTILANHIAPNQKLTILDLSLPSNVDASINTLKNVNLIGIDVLSKITDRTLENRKTQVPLAKKKIEKHKSEFLEWLNIRKFTPAINSLKDSLNQLRTHEIELQKANGAAYSQAQVEQITTRIVHKITTQFAKHIRSNTGDANESIDLMYKILEISPNKNQGKESI